MSQASIVGKLYFKTFIDDHKRKVWTYFLGKKSKAFKSFNEWKVLDEK
jgi:hypothetical protein